MNLHRKIEHNKMVCHAQRFGSYAQGQGHNHVGGQIVPKIVLLINFWSKFDETSQKDKGQGRSQVRDQTCVSAITQKLLKQI